MRRLGPLALTLALAAACTRLPAPDDYFKEKGVASPAAERFSVCHGYDCTFRSEIALRPEEWRAVEALFQPLPASAAAERRAIGQAIALFERQVAERIGTEVDTPGLAYIAAGDPTQQDCIDESTNATVYLTLLRDAGLMRRHEVADVASRGVFLDFRWYHQTAVMLDLESGEEWAVDSWFERNGVPPVIVPLGRWQSAYGKPSES
jgi:hypothetical protein